MGKSSSATFERLRRPPICIGRTDHGRLQTLALGALLFQPRAAGPLLAELDRATVLSDDALPPDLVRLDGWVTYTASREPGPRCVQLRCMTAEAAPGELSVLTPTGAALIGLRVGQSILWDDHLGGEQWFTVQAVTDGREARP